MWLAFLWAAPFSDMQVLSTCFAWETWNKKSAVAQLIFMWKVSTLLAILHLSLIPIRYYYFGASSPNMVLQFTSSVHPVWQADIFNTIIDHLLNRRSAPSCQHQTTLPNHHHNIHTHTHTRNVKLPKSRGKILSIRTLDRLSRPIHDDRCQWPWTNHPDPRMLARHHQDNITFIVGNPGIPIKL